ncbi:hypothetical protein REMIM1_PC00088 (plasmid) [Rhizobium etli bv. mimosae str. Mim1]|nr:hypothetical protein REMIM1_PC00088 [Rhizobium etli bv. mimosae str. Mim1]
MVGDRAVTMLGVMGEARLMELPAVRVDHRSTVVMDCDKEKARIFAGAQTGSENPDRGSALYRVLNVWRCDALLTPQGSQKYAAGENHVVDGA